MSANVLVSTKKEFEDLIASEEIVLVDFWASWCGPCRMLAPVIEQIGNEYQDKIKVTKIDVDQESELAQIYDVKSVPTVIIFKSGKIHSREVGLKPIGTYKNIIDSLI